eukprot:m.14871 g.14871  ORF g.14871 m.14871 type:complete len:146 (-) comp10362_c0_seq2:30-467(-)
MANQPAGLLDHQTLAKPVLDLVCGSQIDNDVLSSLLALFGHTLEQALNLVDRRAVCKYTTASGRTVCEINSTSGQSYIVLLDARFCSCHAYEYTVLKHSALLCKHLLAAEIATRLDNAITTEALSEQAMALTLLTHLCTATTPVS